MKSTQFIGDNPLVSIIIPVYNGSNYLSQAIDSALAQTYQNVEVLVVNDGSSDAGKVRDIAKSYGTKIRYFEKKNGGVSTALNLGIREMNGDYFSWLSHDDFYLKDKIEKQLKVLLGQKNKLVIVYADSSSFSDSVENRGPAISAAPHQKKSFRYFVATSNVIHGCSLLIPKIAFERFGAFDEELRYVQDYEMWFRLAAEFNFLYIPEVLVLGRTHCNQTGNLNRGDAKHEVDLARVRFFRMLTPADFGGTSKRDSCSSIVSYLKYAINNEYPLLTKAIYEHPACNKFVKYLYILFLNLINQLIKFRNNIKIYCFR